MALFTGIYYPLLAVFDKGFNMDASEEAKRVSIQVTSLSTQLIESVDKQSHLEEQLNKSLKTIASQKAAIENYNQLKEDYNTLKRELSDRDDEVKRLREDIAKENELRTKAEEEADKLNKEVEDLTASLFDEANNMVADARKEKYAIEILNKRLTEQLREKDTLLDTLTLQLKNLKKVMHSLDNESTVTNNSNRYSTILSDSATSSSTSLNKVPTSYSLASQDIYSGIVYSPSISSIRYDISLYNEFLKFVAALPRCENIKATSTESKLIRRLVNDEIQPILKIDNASGIGWLVKKTLLSLIIDGLVVVEPLSGVNSTYQIGYNSSSPAKQATSNMPKMFKFPLDSPPVAVHAACSFCGESRDDIIEHARMYILKTLHKTDDGKEQVTNTYPLCHWCLLKLRQTCEIFAFLRSLKVGAWHLEKLTTQNITKEDLEKFSEVTKHTKRDGRVSSQDKKTKRLSFMAGLGINSSTKNKPKMEIFSSETNAKPGQPTTNIQRAWLQLCKLRCILHWTHIGIWAVDDSISSKIGPLVEDDSDEDQNDAISVRLQDKALWKQDAKRPFSSSSAEESQKSDAFDFESGDMENEITGESSSDESSSDGSSTDNSTADSSSEDESSLADSTTSSADSSSPESIDNGEGDDTVTKDDKSSIKSANNNEENSDCGDKKGRSIIKKKAPQRKIQKKKLLQDLDDLEEQFREESAIDQTEFENAESNVKQNISSKRASSGDENSKKDNNEKTLKTNLTIGDKTQEQIGENSPSSGLHASSSNDDNFDDAQEQQ
ncbi:CFF_HP2_G0039290.mRNA.1.CDS.1 [Saccharomyces cerevisiae]|nr:CFF_HP2_G0039290.mRNA.1.CDS.1 [Saccharomyces cerevisiae]CAI6633599.1 CFF_HP2_G0039290.mRNA.1.CDS.1 [Saccharomyces cerevisiae]CAI6656572.1 CFF_HP1_G0041360.mRNA.1.CDS.1 [Saccharomyces cerevisiae]